MQKIRWYVLVSGRVQDVGFRFFSRCLALLGGLTGWVRNRPDGRVELEIQGPQDLSLIHISRCILLGCAGFAAAAREFTEKLGVPVLDGVTLAVRLAESLVQTGHKNVATLSRAYLETKTMKGFDITF